MRIHLPLEIQERLRPALERAGHREIGGILMGKHIGEAEFRVIDLMIQKRGGSVAYFIRMVAESIASLRRFFKKTNANYIQYNYLGEWHSHPSFTLEPSHKDIHSMLEIITDEEVGANFVILLIVKLKDAQELEAAAVVFLPNRSYFKCEVITESPI